MEKSARAWAAELSKAESDISHATQQLERRFGDISEQSINSGGEAIPDPIKLVRRLTALEIALGSLKRDCEIISAKRNGMVKSVLENQQQNALRVQQVFKMIDQPEPAATSDVTEKKEWEDLSSRLKNQVGLLQHAGSSEGN